MKVIRNAAHQDWRTPAWLFRRLDAEYRFDVDAAATRENSLCELYINPRMDALKLSWWMHFGDGQRYFLNPPFNNIAPFLRKALEESEAESIVVCLLPARVDVAWFHEIVLPYAHEVRFVKGRVRYYHGSRNGKPNFPSMIVRFGPNVRKGRMPEIRTLER